jgi:hypothetical protein
MSLRLAEDRSLETISGYSLYQISDAALAVTARIVNPKVQRPYPSGQDARS